MILLGHAKLIVYALAYFLYKLLICSHSQQFKNVFLLIVFILISELLLDAEVRLKCES